MAETTLDKAVCEECGADVREGTQFCYKCGHSLVAEEKEEAPHVTADTNGAEPEEMSGEARAALDELADRLNEEDAEESDKLAAAAAERKKARVRPARKKRQMVWEPVDEGPGMLFVAITLLICLLAAAIVLLTVYWK